jgi:hypothetical protein
MTYLPMRSGIGREGAEFVTGAAMIANQDTSRRAVGL